MSSAQPGLQTYRKNLVFINEIQNYVPKPGLVFIDGTPKNVPKDDPRRQAQKKIIRSQATRASTHARIETTHRRAESRSTRQPGQGVFRVREELPSPTIIKTKQHQTLSIQQSRRDREASAVLHAQTLLGGPIPTAQAKIAILGNFLRRFEAGPSTSSERPWVKLVMSESTSSTTSSLVTMALQANACALCANDLQDPEISKHAIKLYLHSIARLRSALQSPDWHDPTVMYTCMILTLFETIQSKDRSASHAHVGGVAMLIQRKGPHGFVHGLEHRTFRYYRINIVLMRLAERKPCFLAEPEWKTIPFSGDCPPKEILDLLLDILAEIPGVLFAIETLTKGALGQYAAIQKAFELVYLVRRLLADLEKWKHECIHPHPLLCNNLHSKTMDLIPLCELGTGQTPYDVRLGEALLCYCGAHLILTRIAQRLVERSFLVSAALRPTYSLRDLVAAIVLVAERHISADTTNIISMIVAVFPLKVAQSVDELHDPALFRKVRILLNQINEHFSRKYKQVVPHKLLETTGSTDCSLVYTIQSPVATREITKYRA